MSASAAQTKTNQSATDQRVGAADGGSAIVAYGGNVNITDAGIAKAGLATATTLGTGAFDLVNDITHEFGNLVSRQSTDAARDEDRRSNLFENALAAQAQQLLAITELGKTTATGGQSDFNKTLLYLGVAAAVAVASIFIFRK